MAEWNMTENNVIDYSPTGDDVDSFSQKVDRNLKQLFELVNILHSSGSTTGLSEDDAVAGEIRANLADGGIYIRSADNKEWIMIGEMSPNFGVTPEKINAVRNGGGLGKIYAGTEAAMNVMKSSELSTNDVFLTIDTFRAFRWTGSNWQIFLSRNFGEILNYEKYCVSREEIGYDGRDKILRLDKETGKGNIDITGSPDKIFDKEIDFQDLRDGHAIVFNAEKNKWVNLPNYIFTEKNITYTGEKSTNELVKLVAVGKDGKIHGDFSGNTDRIGNIAVDVSDAKDNYVLAYSEKNKCFQPIGKITGSASELAGVKINLTEETLQDGYVLAYESASGTFVPVPKDSFTPKNATTKGEVGKLVMVSEDGTIHSNLTGSASQIAGKDIDIGNPADGDVIVYHISTKTWRNEPKFTGVGEGKSLILYDNEKVFGTTKRVIFEDEVTKQFTPSQAILCRSSAEIGDGFVSGDGVMITTNLIPFKNKISRAHLTVKHENVVDAKITAEIAIRHNPQFVNGEIIGIGDGTTQTVQLANTDKISSYGFSLYFDGVKQTSDFLFSPSDGKITFTAADNVIVSADYIFDWENETFVPIPKTGIYPDSSNLDRASTQFLYTAENEKFTGGVVAIRLKLEQEKGTVSNEKLGVGTGKAQAFKLPHHAVAETISVNPSTASFIYKENLDTLIVTAPEDEPIIISYDWEGRPFKMDSFAVIFNE